MSKKEIILIFTNVFTVLLLVVLGAILVFSKDKDDTKKEEAKDCTTVEQVKNNGSLVYSNYSEDSKIYLTSNNALELVSKELGNKVIAENVNKTYDIYAGQNDTCDGNRWIVAQSEDNKFIAISIDALSCGNKFEILNVSDEMSKINLNDVTSIYTTETFTNQFEPTMIKVFAINEDGKSTEITSIFE